MTALGRPTFPSKVPSEGTNRCTQLSFANKNVLTYSRIFLRLSEDHPDRSCMLDMGC